MTKTNFSGFTLQTDYGTPQLVANATYGQTQVELRLVNFGLFSPEYVGQADAQADFNAYEQALAQALQQGNLTVADLYQDGTNLDLFNQVGKRQTLLTPVTHLAVTADTPEFRQAYSKFNQRNTAVKLQRLSSQALNQAYAQLVQADQAAPGTLTDQEGAQLELYLKQAHHAGADLAPAQRQRFQELSAQISALLEQYNANALDSRQAWSYLVPENQVDSALEGVPVGLLKLTRSLAQARGLSGHLLTLDPPVVLPLLTHCKNRTTRQLVHFFANNLASDLVALDQAAPAYLPQAYKDHFNREVLAELSRFDNTKIAEEVFTLRKELAQLAGYACFADYSLAQKSAPSVQAVDEFLEHLRSAAAPALKQDVAEYKKLALQDGLSDFQEWDLAYYRNSYESSLASFNPESLRPYFSAERALAGLWKVLGRLWDVRVEEVDLDKLTAAVKASPDFAQAKAELQSNIKAELESTVQKQIFAPTDFNLSYAPGLKFFKLYRTYPRDVFERLYGKLEDAQFSVSNLDESKSEAGKSEVGEQQAGGLKAGEPAEGKLDYVKLVDGGVEVLIGGLYADLFARTGKRQGAWMEHGYDRVRNGDGTKLRLPVAYINGNFNPPVEGQPALLSPLELRTLFHEMGHASHLLLTHTDQPDLACLNQAWDAIELPSQFLENFVWVDQVLQDISEHVETKAKLSSEQIQQLHAFYALVNGPASLYRRIVPSLVDMAIFKEPNASGASLQQVARGVVTEVNREVYGFGKLEQAEGNDHGVTDGLSNFTNSFIHIFSTQYPGYAAGYYSYLWADVLTADATKALTETGDVFNKQVAQAYADNILATGALLSIEEGYRRFRGKLWTLDAFLEQYGLR